MLVQQKVQELLLVLLTEFGSHAPMQTKQALESRFGGLPVVAHVHSPLNQAWLLHYYMSWSCRFKAIFRHYCYRLGAIQQRCCLYRCGVRTGSIPNHVPQ